MKPKEVIQLAKSKQKDKNVFPILYENENEHSKSDYLSRSNTRTDILAASQSRLSKLSQSLTFNKKVLDEPSAHHHDKFATLKFGENKELLFNIDCQVCVSIDKHTKFPILFKLNSNIKVQSLIGFFNEKCSEELKLKAENDSEEVFDLVDLNGQNKHLSDDAIRHKNALLFIEPRKIYVLAKVKHNEKNEPLTIPLVETNKDPIKDSSLTKPVVKKNLKSDMLKKSLSKSDFFNSGQPKSATKKKI